MLYRPSAWASSQLLYGGPFRAGVTTAVVAPGDVRGPDGSGRVVSKTTNKTTAMITTVTTTRRRTFVSLDIAIKPLHTPSCGTGAYDEMSCHGVEMRRTAPPTTGRCRLQLGLALSGLKHLDRSPPTASAATVV